MNGIPGEYMTAVVGSSEFKEMKIMSMLKLEPSSVVLTDTILGSLHNGRSFKFFYQ